MVVEPRIPLPSGMGSVKDDEFDSVSAITDALKEIMADYIEKDMRKKLEEEDD